jgi:hypothetical protein
MASMARMKQARHLQLLGAANSAAGPRRVAEVHARPQGAALESPDWRDPRSTSRSTPNKEEDDMADDRTPPGAAKSAAPEDAYQQLRRLAALGYQLRATLLAADRFLAHDDATDTETAGWLVSSGLSLAEELTTDLDGFAKSWKGKPGESATTTALNKLRMRAHQLQASTRAADHFLDQDNNEDRTNGSWLVASALKLADKLAGESEDLASSLKRGSVSSEPAAVVSGPEAAVRRAAAAAAAAAAGAGSGAGARGAIV